MPEVQIDQSRCIGCGYCVDFCPVEVFDLVPDDRSAGAKKAQATREEACWACDTCVGQCPTNAIRIVESAEETQSRDRDEPCAPPLPLEEHELYTEWHRVLMDILRLRWNPVAISLIPKGQPLPDVAQPRVKLRHCQALMSARRGKSILMPAQCHACPDGTHILGLTEIPPKLASGEIYLQFKKLATIDAAKQMVAERPRLPNRSIRATLVSPLQEAQRTPDVIAVIAQPEQLMWLCMSSSFYSGKRFNFQVSGYNAQCVETTLIPYTTGKFNISLGCYGCRASSDIGDDLMFMGIPKAQMPELIMGLKQLGKKAIHDSRNKVYLPPNL
ncbi:Uncharacterized conserved protein, DUF169 family [Desulfuromusa kysingii]|uniref:Uncharacterized conserved protein, DUF169 family n=1 Tax=Desulfuromusa kysingii TaxID=37625 RepID=A0A1H4A1H1_9BACT|nr:DUF169 domain-containing protein [Desulfuromusa kysingii]SEA30013.1 Uncharacterized conserved protein, DUF169 family [Desulfuromusa kysingii]